jgi:hypothetical protein
MESSFKALAPRLIDRGSIHRFGGFILLNSITARLLSPTPQSRLFAPIKNQPLTPGNNLVNRDDVKGKERIVNKASKT